MDRVYCVAMASTVVAASLHLLVHNYVVIVLPWGLGPSNIDRDRIVIAFAAL